MFGSSLALVVCRKPGFMSYLRYLGFFVHCGVQHVLCYMSFCFSSSCVPYVASVSGLSIFECPFSISNVYEKSLKVPVTFSFPDVTRYSNITFLFRFGNKRASYPFGIISLAHAPVNVTDFSIGSINCNQNNADRGRSIMRVTYIVCDIFRKRKYKLQSSNQSILPYLYS